MTAHDLPQHPPPGPVLITGATAGLGRATADKLARSGIPLLLAVRDPARVTGSPERSVARSPTPT